MLVTITQYARMAKDADNREMPAGELIVGPTVEVTVDGEQDPLSDDTRVIRVATDTAVTLDAGGDEPVGLLPADSVTFHKMSGGDVLTITTVA